MGRWTVGDVMTADVASVHEDASFRQIVVLLKERRVRTVPVVDSRDVVVGVVSESDLLPKLEFAGDADPPRLFEGRRHRIARQKAEGDLARELMTAPAITAPADMPIVEAARLMEVSDVKQVPVVDAQGRLIGIVTGGNLLTVFLRCDGAIRGDVLEALEQLPGVEPSQVRVSVDQGMVSLAGQLDRNP